jgi:hypothetical protein
VVLLMALILLRTNWQWNIITNDRVVAHGLNQIYPKTHKKYVSKVEQNGGFMTEFWSSSNPDKENLLEETESLQECLKRQS